jgi:hypothetical protein
MYVNDVSPRVSYLMNKSRANRRRGETERSAHARYVYSVDGGFLTPSAIVGNDHLDVKILP